MPFSPTKATGHQLPMRGPQVGEVEPGREVLADRVNQARRAAQGAASNSPYASAQQRLKQLEVGCVALLGAVEADQQDVTPRRSFVRSWARLVDASQATGPSGLPGPPESLTGPPEPAPVGCGSRVGFFPFW